MRLFIAAKLPEKTLSNLCRQISILDDFLVRGRSVPKENLHVTLEFLGETSEEKLIYLQSAMDEIAQLPPCQLSVSQVVAWRSAKVICAKFKEKGLTTVHDALAKRLEEAGFSVEKRAFRPHTTLVRDYALTMPFSEAVKSVPIYNMPFFVDEIALMQSTLTPSGAVYKQLYSVKLSGKE